MVDVSTIAPQFRRCSILPFVTTSKSVLPSEFKIDKFIDKGGFSVVVVAHGFRKSDKIAIKVIPVQSKFFNFIPISKEYMPKIAGRAQCLSKEAAKTESNLLRECQGDKFVIRWIGFRSRFGYCYLLTELCETNLWKLFYGDSNGPQAYDNHFAPFPDYDKYILMLIAPIINALCFMHSKNIIHCDVKEENILLTRGGVPKLTDFGCAQKILNGSSIEYKTGVTPFYTPYEVVADHLATTKVDAWAIGAALISLEGNAFVAVFGRGPWMIMVGDYHTWKRRGDIMKTASRFEEGLSWRLSLRGDPNSICRDIIKLTVRYNPSLRCELSEIILRPEVMRILEMWKDAVNPDPQFLDRLSIIQRAINEEKCLYDMIDIPDEEITDAHGF